MYILYDIEGQLSNKLGIFYAIFFYMFYAIFYVINKKIKAGMRKYRFCENDYLKSVFNYIIGSVFQGFVI